MVFGINATDMRTAYAKRVKRRRRRMRYKFKIAAVDEPYYGGTSATLEITAYPLNWLLDESYGDNLVLEAELEDFVKSGHVVRFGITPPRNKKAKNYTICRNLEIDFYNEVRVLEAKRRLDWFRNNAKQVTKSPHWVNELAHLEKQEQNEWKDLIQPHE